MQKLFSAVFNVVCNRIYGYFKLHKAILRVKAEDGETVLNLKCPPDLQLFLREKYPEWVLPSYHMSKTHWISVVIASDMPEDEIKQLIKLSYEITESGKSAKNG